jgi:hypothetical protein
MTDNNEFSNLIVNLASNQQTLYPNMVIDTNYAFAPYVPLTQTPIILDPNSFAAREEITLRYSREALEEEARHYQRYMVGVDWAQDTAIRVNWQKEGF